MIILYLQCINLILMFDIWYCSFFVPDFIPYLYLSWGSGANAWGPEKDDQFQKPTHYDGMLEVVGIKGVVHMGQIQSGMTGAIRIAQGGRVIYFSVIIYLLI